SSNYNTGSDLFTEKEQDAYEIVNARIGLRGPNQRWSIELWAQNIFDTNYQQVAFNAPFQGGNTLAQVRQFGAQGVTSATNPLAWFTAVAPASAAASSPSAKGKKASEATAEPIVFGTGQPAFSAASFAFQAAIRADSSRFICPAPIPAVTPSFA